MKSRLSQSYVLYFILVVNQISGIFLTLLILNNMERIKQIENVRISVKFREGSKRIITYYLPLGMFGNDFAKFKVRNKAEIEKLKQYEEEDIQKLSPTDNIFNECVAQ